MALPLTALPDFEHPASNDLPLGKSMMTDEFIQNRFDEVILGKYKPETEGGNHGESSSSARCHIATINLGTFADGDPFLVKLQEIDCDLRKFDRLLGKILGSTILNGVGGGGGYISFDKPALSNKSE